MKYVTTIGCICILLIGNVSVINSQLADNQRISISKSIEIFNSLFKELNMFYVDTIDAEKTAQIGIKAMLESLDPYTVYYSEDKMSDLEMITTGHYAGIGASIMQREDKIMISEPFEGMPAVLHGLRVGDEILEIDGESMTGKTSSYASEKLKGTPGTNVRIVINRKGEKKPFTIHIERKRIHINSVAYHTAIGHTGYIFISNFTAESSREVKEAFDELKNKYQITSLIIDLEIMGAD